MEILNRMMADVRGKSIPEILISLPDVLIYKKSN